MRMKSPSAWRFFRNTPARPSSAVSPALFKKMMRTRFWKNKCGQLVIGLVSVFSLISCGGLGPQAERQKLLRATGGMPPIMSASLNRPFTVPLIPGVGQRLPVVSATLNGKHRVPLLIDTGGNHTLISQKAADRSDLRRFDVRGEIVTAFGNKKSSQLALIDSLKIGPAEYQGVQALIHSFTSPRKGEGLGAELNLIGTPTLGSLAYLQLDYQKKRATFSTLTPCTVPPQSGAQALPLSVSAEGHLTVPITFPLVGTMAAIVDTGYDGMLLVDAATERKLSSQLVAVPNLKVKAIGPGSTQVGQVSVLPLLKLGSVIYAGVPVWSGLAQTPPILGSGFLEKFHVTFDFTRMTLWLAPKDGAFKLVPVPTS
jgi:predicted aspartyl protease